APTTPRAPRYNRGRLTYYHCRGVQFNAPAQQVTAGIVQYNRKGATLLHYTGGAPPIDRIEAGC
ncbi:MAG: hypothetical protein WBC55_09330, partial [Dehalococcoidia bacterium]